MKEKNTATFNRADLIIVKYFGSSVEKFYGEKYPAINKYLKDIDSEIYKEIDIKSADDFVEKTILNIQPLVDSIVAKNRKSKTTFTRLKELVEKNNSSKIAASLKDVIESIETGVQGIFESSKKSVIEVLDFITSPDGLIYLPSGATRGSTDSKSEKVVPFEFKTDVIYDCEIIHEVNTIKVVIKCNDQSKEFFLTGNGFAQTATPTDGVAKFVVPDKGEYILSESGLYFRALSLK